MKNYKLFFVACFLMLATLFVFANDSRVVSQEMYGSTSNTTPTLGNSVKLTETVDLVGFSTSGTQQAEISNNSGAVRYVFAYDGTNFTKLYATGW